MAALPTGPTTPDEIRAFHRDGAVLLRGVLAPEWVSLLADGLEECFAERSNKSSEAVISGGTVRVDHMLSNRSASLAKFATESPVGGLVGAVLGGPVRFYMDQMFFRRPGPMAQTAFHQDASYHNVEPRDLVRAWASPDVVPRSASLEVVRGSHRWNVTFRPSVGRDPDDEAHALKVAIARKRGMFENEGEEFSYSNILMDKSLPPTPDIYRHRDSFDIMGWDYDPGDLILFHGSLLHGTAKDVILDRDRRAYAALYAGPRTTYLRQKGQKVPDPPALAAYEPETGQKLESFGDVFPLVWSPGDWDWDNCSDRMPDSGFAGSYSVGTTVSHSPVLVVSIDGLAPRHISRATMPTLTTLALEGASCFSARTLAPPETLPVHTSIFRGVDPAAHGLFDNTPAPLRTDAPSFLGAAREAGRSTAMFVSWLPFDSVIEPDAASQRFVIDSGYDLDDDRRIVDAVVATDAVRRHDLSFVYLSQPDLSGHLHGWDSAGYVAAATRSDAALARLLEAAGPEASVLVTTDHGGLGSGHDSTVREVMETFVVVRAPGRVRPGSGWSTASPLDVAPTVADLCGFEPAHGWQGSSLLGRELPLIDVVMDLLAGTAAETYGERVTMLDHALQSAALAAADGAGDEMVLACLLHDLGHVLGRAGDWGLPGHAELGARVLQPLLDSAIVEPVRGHVMAKRYCVAVEPGYHDRLSRASQMSLVEQGGPLCAEDAEAFRSSAFASEAMRLRAYDDNGKVDGVAIGGLEDYRGLLDAALTPRRPIDPAWARDACRCDECRDPVTDQHLVDASMLDGWTVVRTDRSDDRLTVTLHHHSGERHVCNIPVGESGDLRAERWPPKFAERVRADSTSWSGEHGAFVDQLARRGIALLRDCGVEPATVLEVGNTIGFVRETNYGTLFDVVAEPDPINLAFTPLGLAAHTDNPYRDPCPTVQLLHCLAAASDGGASRFVDGFAAAERLREGDPAAFETLASTDVTFRFRSADVDLRARRRLIELDADGAVRAVSVNNRSMEPLPADRADSAAFYRAYRLFVALLDRSDCAIEITLQPGELVAFDNRRVLHGRRAFRSTERRHLQGCYIDIDAVRSRARLRALSLR